jgi:hypothetical protein
VHAVPIAYRQSAIAAFCVSWHRFPASGYNCALRTKTSRTTALLPSDEPRTPEDPVATVPPMPPPTTPDVRFVTLANGPRRAS